MYDVELVWNREFHWTYHSSNEDLEQAIHLAKELEHLGDGGCVKKVRVTQDGEAVWQYGKMVQPKEE